MVTEETVAIRDNYGLPSAGFVQQELGDVRNFQVLCQKLLISGHDYGIIPGTNKPTLLKPGAEKVAKLLRLADTYEILNKIEDWNKGLFAYEIRAILSYMANGQIVSTGLGECNSWESKYRYRWVFASQLPPNMQGESGKTERDKLTFREVTARGAKTRMYRLENENPADLKNTILKMAKKRALVDAALSAGRLSDIFTQDIEDHQEKGPEGIVRNEVPIDPPIAPNPVTQDEPTLLAASKGTANKLSPDRVDALSRALTAAGYLPGPAREKLFAKSKITTLAELTPERANALEAWLQKNPAIEA